MAQQIQVKKRDESNENYDQAKIARVVTEAGLTQEQGKQLATRITKWALSHSNTVISSSEIRDKVVEELTSVNPNAANLYDWYEKTKDKKEEVK